MSAEVTPRLADLGGTHHGRLPEQPARAPHVRVDAPRSRPRIRFVLDRQSVRRVLDGEKTRHARLWKRTDTDDGPCQVGDLVPVQKSGAGVICRVRVLDVDMVELGELLNLVEVRRHGYRTLRDFQRAWLAEIDTWWRRLDDDARDEAAGHEIDEAWARHADKSVWVYTFGVDTLQPLRYIADGIQRETGAPVTSDAARGYTSNPDRAVEPDAPVADDTDLERWTQDGEQRHQAHHRTLTEDQLKRRTTADDSLIERFTQTVALARSKNIDPHSQIRLVGRALGQLEQAIRAKHAEERA
ncbi:MAG: hypothetical protein PGN13_16155 [Patulibacter minatonensis]